jgi:hypothetical protein
LYLIIGGEQPDVSCGLVAQLALVHHQKNLDFYCFVTSLLPVRFIFE